MLALTARDRVLVNHTKQTVDFLAKDFIFGSQFNILHCSAFIFSSCLEIQSFRLLRHLLAACRLRSRSSTDKIVWAAGFEPINRWQDDCLDITSVAGLKCNVALAIVPDLSGVRAEEPAVQRSIFVSKADRQGVRHSPVLYPRSQCIEGGFGLCSKSSITVAKTGRFEHSVMVLNFRNHGGDRVIIM